MSISAENPYLGDGNDAIMQSHDRFIDHHRTVLLLYLDGTAPGSAEEPDALEYVEIVLAEWQETFGTSALTAPSLEERTFWCALYLFEDLVELPGPHIDPCEGFLMQNLAEVRELLRHRRSLPLDRFMATRPNGT